MSGERPAATTILVTPGPRREGDRGRGLTRGPVTGVVFPVSLAV